jgi:hypothetical protein
MDRIRLRCLPASAHPAANTDWLYMDAGKSPEEISETVDAREYHDTIIDVIHAHHSQRGDGEMHITRYGNDIGLNYFVILK